MKRIAYLGDVMIEELYGKKNIYYIFLAILIPFFSCEFVFVTENSTFCLAFWKKHFENITMSY